MLSLYDLTTAAYQLQIMLESGEIDEQILTDTLNSMGDKEKIESTCKVIRNLETTAAAFKAEKERMTERQKTAENGVKRLKQALLDYLTASNQKKASAGLFTVSVGTSKAVNISNEDALPDNFFVPQPPKIDRTAIGNAIKSGVEVPGAEIVESRYVRIK